MNKNSLACIEFHLDNNYCPMDLTDEKIMKQPFSESQVFDAICEINRQGSVYQIA